MRSARAEIAQQGRPDAHRARPALGRAGSALLVNAGRYRTHVKATALGVAVPPLPPTAAAEAVAPCGTSGTFSVTSVARRLRGENRH